MKHVYFTCPDPCPTVNEQRRGIMTHPQRDELIEKLAQLLADYGAYMCTNIYMDIPTITLCFYDTDLDKTDIDLGTFIDGFTEL